MPSLLSSFSLAVSQIFSDLHFGFRNKLCPSLWMAVPFALDTLQVGVVMAQRCQVFECTDVSVQCLSVRCVGVQCGQRPLVASYGLLVFWREFGGSEKKKVTNAQNARRNRWIEELGLLQSRSDKTGHQFSSQNRTQTTEQTHA